MAEWSKALVLGTSPKGRGFESHRCQSNFVDITNPKYDDCEITIQKSQQEQTLVNLTAYDIDTHKSFIHRLLKQGKPINSLKKKTAFIFCLQK